MALLTREEMAAAVAADIPGGSYVNLGIGLPTLVTDWIGMDRDVTLHTENGMLGMGPIAAPGEEDLELVNAGKIPVTELDGASYFDQAQSFAMMRGGHIDYSVMGAFQVSRFGDLANWHTGVPGAVPSVGGAMDLAVGARHLWVIMELFTKSGSPKLVDTCSYPVTGIGCVERAYTDIAVFEFADSKVVVREMFDGADVGALARRLGMPLEDGRSS